MFEGCSDLRFFQQPLINDRKGFFSSMPEDFSHWVSKNLLFPEQENKTISIQNTTLRLHLPQLNF